MNLVNLTPAHMEQVYDIVVAEDTVPQSFCGGVVPSDDEFVARLWQNSQANLVLMDGDVVVAYARIAGGSGRDQYADVFVAVPEGWRRRGFGTAALAGCRAVARRRLGLRTLIGYVPTRFVPAFERLLDGGEWRRAGVLRSDLYLLEEWSDLHVVETRLEAQAGISSVASTRASSSAR